MEHRFYSKRSFLECHTFLVSNDASDGLFQLAERVLGE